MPEVHVSVIENGPYEVTGAIALQYQSGNPVDGAGGDTVFLCRCGGSTNKPFCDGTHSRTGFQAAERAVAEEG